MKKGWEVRALAEICSVFSDGDWIETRDQADAGFRLLQTGNIGLGEFKDRPEKARFISESTFHRLKCTEVMPGDILVSRLPDPVGRACQVPDLGQRAITAVDGTILRPLTHAVDPSFLVYFLNSDDSLHQVDSLTTGATRKRVSRTNLGRVRIPVPPLAEQKRIVRILDEVLAQVDVAATNATLNLQRTDRLLDGVLGQLIDGVHLEGWAELGEVCVTSAGGTPLKSDKRNYTNGTVPWILSGEVNQPEVTEAKHFISERGLATSSAKMFPPGTVLVAMYGATAGKVSILRITASTNQAVCGILPNGRYVPEFLVWYLRSVSRELIAQAQGNAQPNLSQAKIKKTLLPLLSIKSQLAVVASVESVQADLTMYQRQTQRTSDLLDELRASLLHRAFIGQL